MPAPNATHTDQEETQYESSQSVAGSGQETTAAPFSQQIMSLEEVRMSELIESVPSAAFLNVGNPLEALKPDGKCS